MQPQEHLSQVDPGAGYPCGATQRLVVGGQCLLIVPQVFLNIAQGGVPLRLSGSELDNLVDDRERIAVTDQTTQRGRLVHERVEPAGRWEVVGEGLLGEFERLLITLLE